MTISGEDRPPTNTSALKPLPLHLPVDHSAHEDDEYDDEVEEEEIEHHSHYSTSVKFLVAGGIAGAGPCFIFLIPSQ